MPRPAAPLSRSVVMCLATVILLAACAGHSAGSRQGAVTTHPSPSAQANYFNADAARVAVLVGCAHPHQLTGDTYIATAGPHNVIECEFGDLGAAVEFRTYVNADFRRRGEDELVDAFGDFGVRDACIVSGPGWDGLWRSGDEEQWKAVADRILQRLPSGQNPHTVAVGSGCSA